MAQAQIDENSSLIVEEPPNTESTKWSDCCQVIKDEFRLKNFCFDFDKEKVFYSSQWRLPRLVFMIFRVGLAVYVGTICLLSIFYFPHRNPNRPWPMWLSNWSYAILTCHEIVAATIAVLHVKDSTTGPCCMESDEDGNTDDSGDRPVKEDLFTVGRRKSVWPNSDGSLPCYIRFSWILFNVSIPVAIIATAGSIKPSDTLANMPVKDIHTHVFNTVVAGLDFCIAAVPIRLFHVVYTVLFYAIYYLFSYVFWSFDHTWNVLYTNMDWENPGATMLSLVIEALVVGPILQIILFALYRLKLFIYSKIFGHKHGDYDKL